MSNELTTVAPAAEVDLFRLGEVLAQSGYFQDARQAAQAIVKVMAGRELGFGPIASMTGIHIIQGRPAIGADLMAKAVKRSGRYNYRVSELTDEACSIDFFEKSGDAWQPIGVSRFTKQDATKAKTKNLDAFPRNMLFARAMSNGVKWYCPDALGLTTYTPEELEGIEAAPIQAPAPVAQVEPAISQTTFPEPTAGPMAPDTLRRWLADAAKAAENDNSSALSDGWKGAIRGHIGKLFADKAKAFLQDAFAVESSKDLAEGQWKALLRWLDIRQAEDGQWHADDLAVAESKLWVAEHQ